MSRKAIISDENCNHLAHLKDLKLNVTGQTVDLPGPGGGKMNYPLLISQIRKPVFPPEGGQHNQWYQCDRCQLALKMVDATHHRCPKCGTVYSGYPYDNVVYSGIHSRLTRGMWVCAWAYAVTGEEKYALIGNEAGALSWAADQSLVQSC